MSTFNATINIGTPNPPTPTSPVRGSSLLEFSFYGCRDSVVSGTTEQLTGCTFLTDCDNTPLPGYENVNITEFPSGEIFITGLTFNPIGNQIKWIKVEVTDVANGNAEDNIDCQSKCQNIKINNIPAYTPTPTPTATSIPPTSTPTPTPTATSIPPTSTPTPTPTATVTSPTNTNSNNRNNSRMSYPYPYTNPNSNSNRSNINTNSNTNGNNSSYIYI
jgi:hypothetical protein